MILLGECRALLPVLLRDNWRRGSKERFGRLFVAGTFLFFGLLVAFGVAATLELQDERLRRNLLNLLAALGVLAWLVMTIVGRLEMSRHFDFRGLFVLPVQFRTLYALRVVAGLTGPWLALFGPSILYLLVARTAGPSSAAVALLATIALAVLLGRLVALVLLKLDDLTASWMTTAALLVLALAAAFAVEPVMKDRALDLTEQPVVELIADQVRESRVLTAAGYLPGGLLAAIFEAPRDLGVNLARLVALCLVAAGCMLVEYRILRKESYVPSTRRGDVAGVHLPLARILRRARRLGPSTCLTLIEFDSAMRLKWVRGILLLGVFLAPLVQTGRLLGIVQALVITGFLLGLRNNVYGVAHRSIGERFLLPVRLVDLATAAGKSLTLFPALIFGVAVAWAWQRVGWPGWGTFALWLALPAGILIGGYGFRGGSSVRRPPAGGLGPYAMKLPSAPAGFGAAVCFFGVAIGTPFLLESLARDVSWGPPMAVVGGLALILCAPALGVLLARAADRVARADPHRILDSLADRREEDRAPGLAG